MKQLKTLTFCLFTLSFLAQDSNAQEFSIQLKFHPYLDSTSLILDDTFSNGELVISKFKFYISHLELYMENNLVFSEAKNHYLLDASSAESMQIELRSSKNLAYDEIRFNIGIDSLTNDKGAQSGDLDPMHGMYWAWQSGYINLKLEGKSKRSKSSNHSFQYHIGGFLNFNPIQKCILPVEQSEKIDIEINLDTLVENIDSDTLHHIMRPSQAALDFSNLFPSIFSIKQ